MNIFLDDKELEEIKPVKESDDKGLVISPNHTGSEPERPDIIKEIIANDAAELGRKQAAEIHGVSERSVSRYSAGERVSEDTKSRILDRKHEIQNIAVTKLMQTLNLLDPNSLESEKDKVTVMNGLSQVLDRLGDNGSKSGDRAIHLHMTLPTMKKETDYDVIEVPR